MRSKSVILLVLALGCGVVAAVGIGQVMEGYRTKEATPGEFEKIFVALTDININEPITAQNVSLEEWPKGKVPAEAITKFEDINGKKLRYRLTKGEPILTNKLAGSQSSGITGEIPPGYRIEAVRVDAVSTGGSLLAPGDHVDVLVNLPAGAIKGGSAMTATILQNITVFALDTITVGTAEKEAPAQVTAKTVSLLVTPPQAVKLSLAESLSGATIRLVLRPRDRDGVENNEVDPTDVASTSASIYELLNIPQQDKVAEEAKAKLSQPAIPAADLPPVPSNLSGSHMTIIEGDRMREVRLDDHGRAIIPVDTGSPDDIPVDSPPAPVLPPGT